MTPTAELLDLPKEYGRATRKLAWATVRAWTAFPEDATRLRFA